MKLLACLFLACALAAGSCMARAQAPLALACQQPSASSTCGL
jgi:hypothetical protein